MFSKYIYLVLTFTVFEKVYSQTVDFTVPSTGCLGQSIVLSNNSTGVNNYNWDFCQDGLLNPGTVTNVITTQSSIPVGIEIVYDQGNWYGFACGRENGPSNKITRLFFGNSLNNNPVILPDYNATFNSALNGPSEIKFIYVNSNWYGFVANYYTNTIIRIDFGSSLNNNTPATLNMGNPAGWTGFYGLDIINDNGDYIIAGTGNSSNSISLINYTNTIDSGSPIPSSVFSISSTDNNLIVSPVKIAFQQSNNIWHALFSSLSGNVVLLDFNTSLTSSPTISSVADIPSASALQFKRDGINYYGFVQNNVGDLFRLDFGSSIGSSPQVDPLGNYAGTGGNVYGLAVVKEWPEWKAFFIEVFTGSVYRIDFVDKCSDISIISSTMSTPVGLSYSSPGVKTIELVATDAFNNRLIKEVNITISNQVSPVIDFSFDNICVFSTTSFNPIVLNNQTLTSLSWKFGDGGSSVMTNPSHQYTTAASYIVSLDVFASTGCANQVEKSLEIFNPPISNFTLPSVSPICSNQNYTFINTSTFDNGSIPTWQWSVNGANVSTTQDLNYLIPTTASQSVTLIASIPGCSSQSTQNIVTVQDGPLANFSSPNTGCAGSSVQFTNATTGTVTSYSWAFGDGNTSQLTNPTNTYTAAGPYSVTLTASNSAGCQNFITKNISIYSNPQPDFAIEAPPYSCASHPAQFDNLTPPLSDSNITTWLWNFGDAGNGTSNQKNPTYTFATAATYNVSLQATSNFGCTGAKQQSVIINPSPQAAFTSKPACVNQNTQFTDASSGSISSYQWSVQSTTLSGANPPPYVFKSPGTFPVTLTTISSNGCQDQVVNPITVPVPPVVDFIFQPVCTGKPITFQELNPGPPDPTVAWNWNFGSGSGTGSPVNYSFTIAGAYSVTLTTTRTSKCVYSTSKSITIYEGPKASFTPSVQAGAPPLPVTFNNTSIADSYFWQFDGINTSNEVSPVFTYTEFGEYKVLLKASNIHGCIDTVTTKIYVVIPKIDLAMTAFSLIEDPASSSSKAVVTIQNLGNIPLKNPEVKIDLGGNAQLKEKIASTVLPGKSVQQTLSLEIIPQSIGYICAEVAPSGDVNLYNDRQCVSLTNNNVLFYPYPNPANSQINFDWISSEDENVVLTIYKSNGQVAFEQNFSQIQSGINQLTINTTSLTSGLYLIQFSGAKTKKTFSIMVAHE